jgi:hypothetical protein
MYIIYGTASLCQREFKPLQSSVNPWNPLKSKFYWEHLSYAMSINTLNKNVTGTSATALVIRFCQQGLGLEPGSASSVTDETLDARIDSRLSSCIDSRLAPIQEKLAALESALGEFNA